MPYATMPYWALAFLIIAMVSGLFALTGWGDAAREARVLFFVFTALFVFALFLRRRPNEPASVQPAPGDDDEDAQPNEKGLPTDRT